MKNILTFCPILLFVYSTLCGQIKTNIEFSYSDFNSVVSADIELFTPDGKSKIYTDTLKHFKLTKSDIITKEGEYTLSLKYDFKKTTDSLKYNFTINGIEQEVFIQIRLHQDFISKKVKQNLGYVSIEKINKGSDSIRLEPANLHRTGDQVLLKLTNNSKDTIYGEYLPGFFGGYISYKLETSEWSSLHGGKIDMNFNDFVPLAPDSTTLAYVGSFAEYKYFKTGLCKFQLLYSLSESNNHSYKYRSKSSNTVWWTKTEQFYRLEKEIEVKK